MNEVAHPIKDQTSLDVLAANVTRLRELKGWSQGQLAIVAGVSRATINRIEQAHTVPDWSVVCSLADAFAVSVDEFRSEKI